MHSQFEKNVFRSPDTSGGSSSANNTEGSENVPDYEKKFGHIAEDIMRDSIGKNGIIVNQVDKGTKFEDCDQKVDFWLKFIGLEEPIGVQFTTNPEKYKSKKDFLRRRNWLAQKTKREDADIQWFGKGNVVVVLGDHAKMLNYWKKMENEGKKAEEVVGEEFLRGFFGKFLIEIKEANPAKHMILLGVLETIVKEGKQEAKKAKKKRS